MKKGFLLCTAAILLATAFVSATPAFAATATTFQELSDAIANAGDDPEIEISGTIKLTGPLPDITHENLTIRGKNGATLDGGGAHRLLTIASGAYVKVYDVAFVNAFDKGSGGAIRSEGEELDCVNCVFRDNRSDWDGGAIFSFTSSLIFERCEFRSNIADNCGGAVYISTVKQSAMFLDCLFAGNTAHYGGAAYFDDNAGGYGAMFTNCTFADNKSLSKNGDVLHFFKYGEGGIPDFFNCVLAKTADAPFTVHKGTVDDIIFANTLSAYPAGTLGKNKENADNIENTDPGFRDPDAGDYSLLSGSPAVDAGSSHYYPVESLEYGATDLAGNPRFIDDIDIGAYEYYTAELSAKPRNFVELCKVGTPQLVQAAIDAGADVNAKDDEGRTALDWAISENRNAEVIALLEKAGKKSTAMSPQEFIELCKTGTARQVQAAIDAGADVNARSEESDMTPLMWAASNNKDAGVVSALLKAGADLEETDSDDWKWTPLIFAAGNENPEVASVLIDAGADLNVKTVDGWTALMYAVMNNKNPEIITVLTEAGANLNARDSSGETALMWAARRNENPEFVSALLKAGAGKNARNKKGWTALDLARAENKNPRVARLLEEAGAAGSPAKVEAARAAKNFVDICKGGTPEQIQAALDAGADVNGNYGSGRTALMNAAQFNKNPEAVSVLVKAGAKVNAKEELNGNTALMLAAEYNDNPEVVSALLEAGAEVEAKDNQGATVLSRAAANCKNLEIISVLIEAGADVNARSNDGWAVLTYAAWGGKNPEIIPVLIEAGADVNARDNEGMTALMHAARFNQNPEIISALVKAGVDLNARDNDDQTALDWARAKNKNPEVAAALEKALADARKGASKSAEKNAGKKSSGARKVADVPEFYKALGSDRTIEFAAGEFMPTPVGLHRLTESETELQEFLGETGDGGEVAWEEVYDGWELHLKNMKNLTLRGAAGGDGGPATKLVISPSYAFVITFEDCENITIENLTAGHSTAGECQGGVFRFVNCAGVRIENTEMYGSGTEGLRFEDTSGVSVTSSWIYGCSYFIMTIEGGGDISFKDCKFTNNEQFDLVNISGADGVIFDGCEFAENRGGKMFAVNESRNISVRNTKFHDNSTDESASDASGVEFTDCKF